MTKNLHTHEMWVESLPKETQKTPHFESQKTLESGFFALFSKTMLSKWIWVTPENAQEIFFQEINTKRAQYGISKEPTDKWTTLTEETFFTHPEKMITIFMDFFWFIPEELYTKLIFLTKNNFSLAAKFFHLLKNKEEKIKDTASKDAYRKARNVFLKYIFLDKPWKKWTLKWICSSIQKEDQIALDTNGVWIKLLHTGDSIVSHFPYQLLDDELVHYWFENNWIDENIFYEIKSRQYKKSSNESLKSQIEEKQLDMIFQKLWWKIPDTQEKKINFIADRVISDAPSLVRIILENNLVVPDVVFDVILRRLGQSEAMYSVFTFAEQFSVILNNEETIEHNRDYLLAYSAKNRFTQRKKIATQNTSLYNAYKAIDKAMNLSLPKNSVDFYLLQSQVDDTTHLWFVEVLTQKWVSRTLLNAKKHITKKSGENLKEIPMYSQEDIQKIEVFYASMVLAKTALENIENISQKELFHSLQEIMVFILNYFPEHFQKLSEFSKKIVLQPSPETIRDFVKYTKIIFEKLRFSFDRYITQGQDFEILQNSLSKRTLKFDENFLDDMKKRRIPEYAFDRDLCMSGEEVQVVELKKMSWEQTLSVDYFSELSAIQALNLKQNKPMIVVSGWCKEVSQNGVSSLDVFSWAIVNIAVKHAANISIPGTQSWIWVSMSKKYLEYKNKTKWVSEEKTMKMFAVSTRNNMADTQYKSESTYAPCPVDQIYIPCDADWGKKWVDVINAGYFQFIEWAEQIYNRLDKKKQRLHIIGNGGLFTIAEVNASLKNQARVVLVEWTGRFADVWTALLQSKNIGSLTMGLFDMKKYSDILSVLMQIFQTLQSELSPEIFDEVVQKDMWDLKSLSQVISEIGDKNIETLDEFFHDICALIEKKNLSLTPKQVLYGIYLIEFLKLSLQLSNKPMSCSLENLESFLENIY